MKIIRFLKSKTNNYFFFVSFRSSSKSQPKPLQSVRPENLKNFALVRNHEQRTCKKPLAILRMKCTHALQMFAADLYCHTSCYSSYIGKWKRATSISDMQEQIIDRTPLRTKRDIFKHHAHFIKSIIDQGRGFSLADSRDMINQDNDADLKNNEIKGFLIEEFGDSISFCDPERKNLSLFAFSSSIEVKDVVNSLRNLDVVKSAAVEIRKSLLEVSFALDDSFCDAHQLKQSWKEKKIPEVLLTFFSALFNVSSTKLMRSEMTSDIDSDIFEDGLVEDVDKEEVHDSLLMTRTKSLFQIMHYHVTKGRQKTPLHVMNAHAIYERCKSRDCDTG